MIRLFYTHIFKTDSGMQYLSEYRRRRNANFEQNVCSELLLIHALRECGFEPELPLIIQLGEYGKPYIAECPYHFNISHSEDIILIAVCDQAVGVDIQASVPIERAHKIAARFFTPEEQESTVNFTEIWTRKEAYIKFTGEGLHRSLGSFTVLTPPDGCFMKSGTLENCAYTVCTSCETDVTAPVFVSREELLSGF